MAPDPVLNPVEVKVETEEEADMATHKVDPKRYHSDLEVDNRKHLSDLETVKLGYSDLEVIPGFGMLEGMRENNLQAYHPDVAGNKAAGGAILYHSGSQEPEMKIPVEEVDESSNKEPKESPKICGLAPKMFWALVAILVLLVIGGAVGGAVGGTQSKERATSTTGSNQGATSTAGGTATSTAAVNTGIRPDSQLAALAWTVSSTRYQYRVYYQNTDSSLKESAFDSSSGSWTVSTILDGSNVLSGTYIAASAPGQTKAGSDAVDINVYYFNAAAKLMVISATLGVWNPSQQSSDGQTINEATFGRISAYYDGCHLCPNTTLVVLASEGSITVYNHTSSGAWADPKSFLITSEALDSSDVSLSPYSISNYAAQINVYYQRSDGNLVIVSWFSDDYQIDHNRNLSSTSGWSYNGSNSVVGGMAANASFTTLVFEDENGSPAYGEVVMSGTDGEGLQVFEWESQSWHSATEPDALQDVSRYTAVAAHSYQRVYALSDGALNQYAVDNNGLWTVNAKVPTI